MLKITFHFSTQYSQHINITLTPTMRRLFSLRNKAKDFPQRISFDGEPRAKPAYASKRADGTINTKPQERMRASNKRDNNE